MDNDNIKTNFFQAKIIISLANIIAAILFLVAFFLLKIIWLLVGSLILLGLAYLSFIFITKFENKIIKKN
jgi:hypothetical protein